MLETSMEKTDKELTSEIVIAYLESRAGEGKTPMSLNNIPNLIQTVHSSLHTLQD